MPFITIPPELEGAIEEHAQRQGTTPELLVLDGLNRLFRPATPPGPPAEGPTAADFFAGYVGGLHSGDFVPGGANLSEDSGRKFTEALLKKRREEGPEC